MTRLRSAATGEQLRSVAARYQRPLRPPPGALAERVARRSLPSIASPASPGASFEPVRDASASEGLDVRLQRLEAILFLAREPLSSRKLSYYANLADGTEARTLIRRLNQQYDEAGRAFRVEEFAGGFQLLTRPQFATWLRRLEHVPPETRLSAPALETLAVVAYRQPVLRADIEAIRGVNCGEILRQLMERDLVRIGGRSEELGRPYLYSTTKQFLQLMGLPNLDQLPRADVLREHLGNGSSGAAQAASRDNPTTRTESDHSRDERQPEEAEMRATAIDPRQTTDEDELQVAVVNALVPRQSAEDEDEYEYEYEDDDEDYEDEDEDEEDYEYEYEDEDEDEDADEEEDVDEEEEDEDFEDDDEDFDDEEVEEEDDDEDDDEFEEEEWEEVDDEEEWDDEDMDWEDEYDDMDE